MINKSAIIHSLKIHVKNPGFWLILVLLGLITILHYSEAFEQTSFLSEWLYDLGFTRHAFERILYLAPIVWGGFIFGRRVAITISVIAVTAMLPRVFFLSDYPTDALFETVSVFIIGNVVAMTFFALRKERQYHKQLEEAQGKLRLYLGQVNNAQEEERKRISHELHDDTIQELVVLSRKLDVLASDDPKLSEECRLQLEELRKQTNSIMIGIRRLSQDLRPAALDRLGLIPAIEWLTEDITKYSGIPIKVTFKGEERRLSEEKELVLFRIVQEAVRNIAHHSRATQAEITIECSENIGITISDNGQGFTMPKKADDLQNKGKLGLVGMMERAQLIGAVLQIKSEPGKGTDITISVEI